MSVNDQNAPVAKGRLRKVLPGFGWAPSYWTVSQIPTLSLKALGLHTYLMSLPDDWNISSDRVVEHRLEGRDSVRAAMKELEEHGLLSREQTRSSSGQICTITTIYAVPRDGFTEAGKAAPGPSRENKVFPQVAPEPGNPASGGSGVYKEKTQEERERDNYICSSPDERVDEQQSFDEFWKSYPRKIGKPSALKAWKRMSGRSRALAMEGVGTWTVEWVTAGTPKHLIPYPATWLRDERYNDTPSVGAALPVSVPKLSVQEQNAALTARLRAEEALEGILS